MQTKVTHTHREHVDCKHVGHDQHLLRGLLCNLHGELGLLLVIPEALDYNPGQCG